MSNPAVDAIRERIDVGPIVPLQLTVIAIGFLLNFVDGFDVVAMSVAAPALSEDWGISPEEKGYILSAALVGMTIGAALLAPYADRIGRRAILILATIGIGVSMIVTGLIPQSIELMIAIRLISGLGIGIIFANTAAIGTEFASEKFRNIAVTTIVMGYPFGAMVVGPVANVVIPAQGWQMLFIYGGFFTLLMTVVIYFLLPESVEYLATRKDDREGNLAKINATLSRMRRATIDALPDNDTGNLKPANVGSLFTDGYGRPTFGIWTVYFMGFLSLYFLLSWIPTLFVDSGFERSDGIRALTINNLGAVLGILAIGLTATRIKLAKPIAVYFFGAGLFLALIYFLRPETLLWLNVFIFLVGFLQQGAFTAMYALAARVYPTSIRATGVGWAAGLGRVGAILSPIIAGYLIAAEWTMYGLFLLFAVPMFIAGAVIFRYKE